jgi:hypothetical protein
MKRCVITKSSGPSAWRGVAKWKATIMGRNGPRGSCERKVLHSQKFVVGYLQSLDRKLLHTALCSAGYVKSVVARKLRRRLSVCGIATPLKKGTLQPSEALRELAAMYWPTWIVRWASSFLMFCLKIIKLLQMRWIQIISESPSYTSL